MTDDVLFLLKIYFSKLQSAELMSIDKIKGCKSIVLYSKGKKKSYILDNCRNAGRINKYHDQSNVDGSSIVSCIIHKIFHHNTTYKILQYEALVYN